MRYFLTLAMLAGISGSALALTEDQLPSSAVDVQKRSISASAINAKLDKLGYDVRRLQTDRDHYEAYMVDRASGGAVEATFSKTSGELLRAKLAESEHEERKEVSDRKETREHRESREQQESRERGDMRKHQESHEHDGADSDK